MNESPDTHHFAKLFKVEADFEERMERDEENQQVYARLIATMVDEHELRPFDREAVARVIERSARLVGDAEKLSTERESIEDLLREANHWAKEEESEVVTAAHIQRAIDAQIYRADRVRDRMQEAILRETVLIDTEGEEIGQVNGLSVIPLSNFAFGRPTRITARVSIGKGEVVDIEREVELSGPIHSKGVLILAGFLGARYAEEKPLSLSAIAEVPLRQSLAVTGSVNQRGQVQAIGGVNEKIEGFFDICEARGLTGEQGVLIPAANVKHLMLRHDVVEAVEEGQFHIYPVETVDEGLEMMTGIPAGERDEEGNYPEDTVNHKVEARLSNLAEMRAKFSESVGGDT